MSTSLLFYWPCLVVGGRCGHMLLNECPDQGRGIIFWWLRRTLSVATHSISGEVEGKEGSWIKL